MKSNRLNSAAVSSPGHHKALKPATVAGFRFLKPQDSQNVVMKYVNYKPPRIVKGKHHWYVEYSYINPQGKWQRFRVYEDINRYRSEEYNQLLLTSVNEWLARGFNPFAQKVEPLSVAKPSLSKELDSFMAYCKEKGLSKKTLQTYGTVVEMLKENLLKNNVIYQPPENVTRDHIKQLMTEQQKAKKWQPSTFNNTIELISTIWNWFIKEEKATSNPAIGVEKKKAIPRRHAYYDDKLMEKLKTTLAKHNPYLLSYCEFLYYSAIRPKTEGPQLQVKHILFDRDLIEVPGAIDKTNRNNFIPLDPELKSKLEHLKKFPPNYFIWGKAGPSPKRVAINHWARVFYPYKQKLGLDETFTLYSLKHTRAIHLAKAGVDPYLIMKLFRHADLGSTMKYLRDLGADIDWSKYKNTRKF